MALAQVLLIQIRTEPSSMILSYLFIERAHRHTTYARRILRNACGADKPR
jgi:hypothetical protein